MLNKKFLKAVILATFLRDAGYTKRNSDGWLVQESTGRELRFEINIYKTLGKTPRHFSINKIGNRYARQ